MLTIVGLGNPGDRYDGTRHNIGYEVVEALAHRLGETDWQRQRHLLNSEQLHCIFRSQRLCLIKPGTYMNESGHAIDAYRRKHGLDLERLWVIHDDTEIPFGEIRVKRGGTSGGHNGIKSLDEEVGSEYWRIRVGIGRPAEANYDLAAYVLAHFSSSERAALTGIVDRTVSYLIKFMEDQIEAITFDAKKDN